MVAVAALAVVEVVAVEFAAPIETSHAEETQGAWTVAVGPACMPAVSADVGVVEHGHNTADPVRAYYEHCRLKDWERKNSHCGQVDLE